MKLKNKDISLFFSLCALLCILPIGYTIRYNFDLQEYDYMIINIGVAIFFIWIGKYFMTDAFSTRKESIIDDL